MRAKEFINEAHRTELRKGVKHASANLTCYDALDNNASPYKAYRFGVALAGSPDHTMDRNGPIGSNFSMLDYTDADAEIRKGAEKVMGITSPKGTGKSRELTDVVNAISPVATIKKNKYGI